MHIKLLKVPNEEEVYAGHMAGSACGAGISGKAVSTLGFEKRWIAMLSLDRAAFIEALTRDIPRRPAEMDRIVALNSGA